jgi:large subunit ribosomal protein L31e
MTIERTYTIPLRKEFQKAPKYRRAKRAITAVRTFMEHHMKSDNVLIGPMLNLKVWEHGIKNPPHHVKVTAVKDEKEGTVRVELFGFEFKAKEKKEKKEKAAPGLAGKLQEKLAPKEEAAPKEAVPTKKDLKEKKPAAEHKPAEKKEAPKKEHKATEKKD